MEWNGWMNGMEWMDEWNGWMNGMAGWMDGMNGWIHSSFQQMLYKNDRKVERMTSKWT